MAANTVEEPHLGDSQDNLSDSSATSFGTSHITGHSPSTVGKLEYLTDAPEVRTFPSFHKKQWISHTHIYMPTDSYTI